MARTPFFADGEKEKVISYETLRHKEGTAAFVISKDGEMELSVKSVWVEWTHSHIEPKTLQAELVVFKLWNKYEDGWWCTHIVYDTSSQSVIAQGLGRKDAESWTMAKQILKAKNYL